MTEQMQEIDEGTLEIPNTVAIRAEQVFVVRGPNGLYLNSNGLCQGSFLKARPYLDMSSAMNAAERLSANLLELGATNKGAECFVETHTRTTVLSGRREADEDDY